MPGDIFHGQSPARLRKEIQEKIAADLRTLPERSKIFAAIAAIQGFDGWPTVAEPAAIDEMVAGGAVELQRGISESNGIPAITYAKELIGGPMYPGTFSAFGTGIYFANPGPQAVNSEPFAGCSSTALNYARKGGSGVIVRAALPKGARIAERDELNGYFRENRNRATEAGITDFGSFCAALGFDGFVCDKVNAISDESWYVLVNRKILVIQNSILQLHQPAEGST